MVDIFASCIDCSLEWCGIIPYFFEDFTWLCCSGYQAIMTTIGGTAGICGGLCNIDIITSEVFSCIGYIVDLLQV